MVDSAQKDCQAFNYCLNDILITVKPELDSLERKLIQELSGNNPFLNKITEHIIQAGGKRLRPALVFLFSKAFNGSFVSSNHLRLAIASELIHTATLIHDDIIDEADERRGIQTINSKWSDKAAVIAGDYLLAKSLKNLALTKNVNVIEIFSNILSEICEGEITQNSEKYQIPLLESYIEKSKRKTAMLFIACTEGSAVLSPNSNNLKIKTARDYALNFGIAFQIIDDVLNYMTQNNEADKPVGSDLFNGIITAPAIFAVEEYAEKGDFILKNLIENGLNSSEEFDLALELILNTQGINKSIKLAEEYSQKACQSIETLEENEIKQTLTDLAQFVINRKK
ncbi:MAG: polyprenyl synthetase family protein [bacterium]